MPDTIEFNQIFSYSSLLMEPVALGSKSLKAASMVSSGSVPGRGEHDHSIPFLKMKMPNKYT